VKVKKFLKSEVEKIVIPVRDLEISDAEDVFE